MKTFLEFQRQYRPYEEPRQKPERRAIESISMFYHATNKKLFNKIKREGLVPRTSQDGQVFKDYSKEHVIYLTSDKDTAFGWGNEGHSWREVMVVGIPPSSLDMKLLAYDDNFIQRNLFEYKGKIPPEGLKFYVPKYHQN